MTPRILGRWWTVGVAACTAVVGCSAIPGPALIGPVGPAQVALTTALALERAGDSAVAVDGDSAAATRYYTAASVLRRDLAFDTVMIVVDGSPANFDAVALAVADSTGPGACHVAAMAQTPAARSECQRGLARTTYTLFAWRAGRDRQILQLVVPSGAAVAGGSPVRSPTAIESASSGRSSTARQGRLARLSYSVGSRGAWWGRVSSHITVVAAVGQSCFTPQDGAAAARVASIEPAEAARDTRRVSCQQDGFIFAFVGTIVAPAAAWGAEPGSTTHVVWMAPSHVLGAYMTVAASVAGR